MTDLDYITDTFGLEKRIVSQLSKKGLISLEEDTSLVIRIDEGIYENALSKYREVLDAYYPEPWKVFVLAKVKIPNRLEGFLNILFKNTKEAIAGDMKYFNPSFLLEKDKERLLIIIGDTKIEISRLEGTSQTKRFIYKGYRYTIANEIKR